MTASTRRASKVCEQIARALSDDVWVVAPETDNSGVSHSLSLNDPLRLREIGERQFAVNGTPTDCVIMAVRHIMNEQRPDLVLSGVNRGQNVAEDVTYSARSRARWKGRRSAFRRSRCRRPMARARANPHWDTAAPLRPGADPQVLATASREGVLVNVNFPDCDADDVQGVAMTTQGQRDQDLLRIEPRFDGRSNPYYWIAFSREGKPEPVDGTDLSAIAANRISVTPLRLDRTDQAFMTTLAEALD